MKLFLADHKSSGKSCADTLVCAGGLAAVRRMLFALGMMLVILPSVSAFAAEEIVSQAKIEQTDVFTSGTDGYAIFRIPSIIATTSGTLLAFAEGRVDNGHDTGNIDTVLKRSFDGGKTWGPLQVIWDDASNTCGNPAPVVDRETGRIILLSTWNRGDDAEKAIWDRTSRDTRRVFVSYSTDDGASFTKPREITSTTKKDDWRWYATGPCHGIQLESGRLVIPANHSTSRADNTFSYSHIIYSDDGGETWQLGGSTSDRTNESTVVELSDGRLLLNSRSYHGLNRRAFSWSTDDGASWYGAFLHPDLVEPVCQASTLRITYDGKPAYLFSNPPSKKREDLTVRISLDECATWSDGLLLHKGFGAYSDLVSLTDDTAGCLYERDLNGKNYGRITFARFSINDLVE